MIIDTISKEHSWWFDNIKIWLVCEYEGLLQVWLCLCEAEEEEGREGGEGEGEEERGVQREQGELGGEPGHPRPQHREHDGGEEQSQTGPEVKIQSSRGFGHHQTFRLHWSAPTIDWGITQDITIFYFMRKQYENSDSLTDIWRWLKKRVLKVFIFKA